MDINSMTMDEIRKAGLDALVKALGQVGMVRFLQMFGLGKGDYTKEREEWLDNMSIQDILQNIENKT
jgi:hypothetical protein